MYRLPALPGLLAVVLCLYSSLGTAIDRGLLRLATTSSVQNSGLLEQLVRRFEQESGYQMKVHPVGSGASLRMGRRGLVDAIISHSPEAESLFMKQGHGAVRRPLMQNDFVLVGPAEDPAVVRGLADAAQALNPKMGMHFTQPASRFNLCLWRSKSSPFLALISLERFRSLMNGFAAKIAALTILRNFDGRMLLSAQVVDVGPKSHL